MFSYSAEELFLSTGERVSMVQLDVKRSAGICADAFAATERNLLFREVSLVIAECAFHLGVERSIHFECL